MDYRMYSGGASPKENVVQTIKKELKKQNINFGDTLRMVAFEGTPGTAFYLNGHEEVMKIPQTGKFYTPYNGDKGMSIYRLEFLGNFSGDIYYII